MVIPLDLDVVTVTADQAGESSGVFTEVNLGGRSWYTGGGHTSESYFEPDFRAHLQGGLRYAAGLER